MKLLGTFKGHHTERVTDVVFHPAACKTLDVEAENVATVATASADRTAVLWSRKGKKLQSYEGHLDRLARIAFHPSGAYIGTASFDKTWRLWDVNTGIELLLQEGHSRSVYGIAFQQDGALAASCGMDALARVWDLRTGKSILALEGHVKSVRNQKPVHISCLLHNFPQFVRLIFIHAMFLIVFIKDSPVLVEQKGLSLFFSSSAMQSQLIQF